MFPRYPSFCPQISNSTFSLIWFGLGPNWRLAPRKIRFFFFFLFYCSVHAWKVPRTTAGQRKKEESTSDWPNKLVEVKIGTLYSLVHLTHPWTGLPPTALPLYRIHDRRVMLPHTLVQRLTLLQTTLPSVLFLLAPGPFQIDFDSKTGRTPEDQKRFKYCFMSCPVGCFLRYSRPRLIPLHAVPLASSILVLPLAEHHHLQLYSLIHKHLHCC